MVDDVSGNDVLLRDEGTEHDEQVEVGPCEMHIVHDVDEYNPFSA